MYKPLSSMFYLIPEMVRTSIGDSELRQRLMYRLPMIIFKRQAGDQVVEVVNYKAKLESPIVNIIEAFYSTDMLERGKEPAGPVCRVIPVTHSRGLFTHSDGTVEVHYDGKGCLTVSEEGGWLYVAGETFEFDGDEPLVYHHDEVATVIRDFALSEYMMNQGQFDAAIGFEDRARRNVQALSAERVLSEFDYAKFARRFEPFYHKLR